MFNLFKYFMKYLWNIHTVVCSFLPRCTHYYTHTNNGTLIFHHSGGVTYFDNKLSHLTILQKCVFFKCATEEDAVLISNIWQWIDTMSRVETYFEFDVFELISADLWLSSISSLFILTLSMQIILCSQCSKNWLPKVLLNELLNQF